MSAAACKASVSWLTRSRLRYAYFKKLDYFSTECSYSPAAYRGFARMYLRELELVRPSAAIDIIRSGEALRVGSTVTRAVQRESCAAQKRRVLTLCPRDMHALRIHCLERALQGLL